MSKTVTFTVEEITDMAQGMQYWSDMLAELNEDLSNEIGCVGVILEKLLTDGVIAEPVTLPAG